MFRIHPDTGALQVVDMEYVAAEPAAAPAEALAASGLYQNFKDRQLLRLGVPEDLLPLVRGLTEVEGLDEIREPLPAEAYEALFYLAAGDPYEQVVRDLESARETVDTEDYLAALNHPDSRRRFHVISDDALLGRMLAVPLELGVNFDDLDGGGDGIGVQVSLLKGSKPEVRCFDHAAREREAIRAHIERLLAPPEDGTEPVAWSGTCLVARTEDQLENYQAMLKHYRHGSQSAMRLSCLA